MDKLKLLVIEDDPKHLQDITTLLQRRIEADAPLEPVYVSSLVDAERELSSNEFDGIISDVHFPEYEGSAPENQARSIYDLANSSKTPLVFCTDGYHHGPHLEETNDWVRENLAINKEGSCLVSLLVDMMTEEIFDQDHLFKAMMKEDKGLSIKNWPSAYSKLIASIGGMRYGFEALKNPQKSELAVEESKAFTSFVSEMSAEEVLEVGYMKNLESLKKLLE